MIALRDKQSINAVSAFEIPVHAGESEPVSRRAAKKLGERLSSIEGAYDLGATAAWYVTEDGAIDEFEAMAKKVSLSEMIKNIQNAVAESCRGGE